MVQLMSGLLRLRKKFQNSLLLDHVVKTTYQRGGHIGVPALFGCVYLYLTFIFIVFIFFIRFLFVQISAALLQSQSYQPVCLVSHE